MGDFLEFSSSDGARYEAATRFVDWLENRVVIDARGDEFPRSEVDPTGRFWLGRLGPKDFVSRQDQRGDRLEPCAIGLRIGKVPGFAQIVIRASFHIWKREKAEAEGFRWQWVKSDRINCEIEAEIDGDATQSSFGAETFRKALDANGAPELAAEIRLSITIKSDVLHIVEISLVNVTATEEDDFCDSRFFQCDLQVLGLNHVPFELDSLPDSFRFNRKVEAFGINCGFEPIDGGIRTNDSPAKSRFRPDFWSAPGPCPDLRFDNLAQNPLEPCRALLSAFEDWASRAWSDVELANRADNENWSPAMIEEAAGAQETFSAELQRIRNGVLSLEQHPDLRTAFTAMNRAMKLSAAGKYDSWRPFQIAFLLANLNGLIDQQAESDIVDIVWFATGGGKTETYLGLLVTAAFLDRMRGKLHGITAWSRFPLRLLSLQQTQRFANALAAAELVRRDMGLLGDEFALGFLVGGSATPNRIKKESSRDGDDADKLAERQNPYRLLEQCPFCRQKGVTTRFNRATWRLIHECPNPGCASASNPLPIYVVDDEIWRLLPTIVVGTLDKAANIARQTGMRALVGPPWGYCSKAGHGFTYATRGEFPNGCLVPDCKGVIQALPMPAKLFPPTFRLQDELHLLRDSLGAVDAHYEAALDGLQREISGFAPKILASSATLSGYAKQVSVLYNRIARVFPQPPPVDGKGFWTADSQQLMRRYIALAPRRLTVEFVVDRLVITLQQSIRTLADDPKSVCEALDISTDFASFLVDIYGTNVIYGNTLKDIDAVIRSAETQYGDLVPPPNVASLTGRTDFREVGEILERLEKPEEAFSERIHLVAASSMMSHGVDINRLNVMVMLAFPLGVAEFIQATARVGRRWPAIVIVVPKMTRERDASVYRAFPEFVSHGDRFVEPIPITRKSRQVLKRTIAGLEMARIQHVHEPNARASLAGLGKFNAYVRDNPNTLADDKDAIAAQLGFTHDDELLRGELDLWFEGFDRNLRQPPADVRLTSGASPSGDSMTSLRDVEEQAPIFGDSTQ